MRDFLSFAYSIFAAFFIIEVPVYQFVRMNKKQTSKTESKGTVIFFFVYAIILLLISSWLFFFKEKSVYLECRQDTMTCSYFRSVPFSKKMWLAKKYDISLVTRVKVREYGSNKKDAFYTVVMIGIDRPIELPPRYSYSGAAQKEADKINRFLKDKTSVYTFKASPSHYPIAEKILFLCLLVGIFFEIFIFWTMSGITFGKYKKRKEIPHS